MSSPIATYLDSINAAIVCARYPSRVAGKYWWCQATLTHEGTKVECEVRADTIDECFAEVEHKLRSVLGGQLAALATPLLEHDCPPAPGVYKPDFDSDIPF